MLHVNQWITILETHILNHRNPRWRNSLKSAPLPSLLTTFLESPTKVEMIRLFSSRTIVDGLGDLDDSWSNTKVLEGAGSRVKSIIRPTFVQHDGNILNPLVIWLISRYGLFMVELQVHHSEHALHRLIIEEFAPDKTTQLPMYDED